MAPFGITWPDVIRRDQMEKSGQHLDDRVQIPNIRVDRSEHKHAEAFCLMKYRTHDGEHEEIIWNSRDGVTPFSIRLTTGEWAYHVEWRNDVYAPDHKPAPGDRIFTDLTEEKALEYARRNLSIQDPHGNSGLDPHVLANEYMENGTPDIVIIS